MQDVDYQWFLDNYDELYQKYGESYIAIKNQHVLGVYPSFAQGVFETDKTEAPGTYIVQYCNGDESGYTDYIASTYFMND